MNKTIQGPRREYLLRIVIAMFLGFSWGTWFGCTRPLSPVVTTTETFRLAPPQVPQPQTRPSMARPPLVRKA